MGFCALGKQVRKTYFIVDKFFFSEWKSEVQNQMAFSKYKCKVTDDKNQIKLADAVLFHAMDLYFWIKFPSYRHVNQTWVWYNMEAPPMHHYRDFRSYKNIFNWTVSYRTDSTVFTPYGHVRPLDPLLENATITRYLHRNYAKGKTKLAFAVVGNCYDHGNRYQIINQLSQYIQIDYFGSCGNLRCPKENPVNCSGRLYKFKLSLENAICKDYVTEKFWMALDQETLPIVYWPRHVKNIPDNSYINIKDFPSIKSLANYLILLDKNDTLYNQYFAWKAKYVFTRYSSLENLCDHIHLPRSAQTIHNPTKWLKKDICKAWTIMGRVKKYFARTLFDLGFTSW